MSRIKILSQKPAFKAHHFLVKESRVTFDDQEHTYHHVEVKPCVYILPVTKQNEIYLIKQYRYIFDTEFLEIPAGVMNEGEEPLASAKRELEEETGLIASEWRQVLTMDTASSIVTAPMYYFLAKNLKKGLQNPDPDENIAVVKVPIKEAVAQVLSGEIHNHKTVTGILLVNTLLEQGKL